MKLIAIKPLRYRTRRLQAGDEFDATDLEAIVYVMRKKARHASDEPAAVAAPPVVAPQPAPEPAEQPDIDDLREEAEALGVEVDGRWGVNRLQNEIARAKL